MALGSDKPLAIERITAYSPRRHIVFALDPAKKYRLRYGHKGAQMPKYDIGQVYRSSRFEDFIPAHRVSDVNGLKRNPAFKPWVEKKPWTETRPVLLWVAMLLALGAFIFLAMQQVKRVE